MGKGDVMEEDNFLERNLILNFYSSFAKNQSLQIRNANLEMHK